MRSYGRVIVDVARNTPHDQIVLRCGTQQRGGPTIFTTEIIAGNKVLDSDVDVLMSIMEGTLCSLLKRTVGIQTALF